MWPIIRNAIANASDSVRRLAWTLGAFSVTMAGLQIWDSRNGEGAAGAAELAGTLLGVGGMALFGLAQTLNLAMKEAAERVPASASRPDLQHVLLALPLVGFIAGLLLASATALTGMRGYLGAERPLVIVGLLVYGGLTMAAGHVVMRAVGTLFKFAAQQAASAARLETAAKTAKLDALNARLSPHMLFNALNTIASLVRTNPRQAEETIENLADVLRAGLDRSTSLWSTVQHELAYTRTWLEIERQRWREALDVEWQVDGRFADVQIPAFTVQPLVENALIHGLGGRSEGGCVRIEVSGTRTELSMQVADDGVGFPEAWQERDGLGTLRQRLQTIYGAKARLLVHSVSTGARVEVRLPLEKVDAP